MRSLLGWGLIAAAAYGVYLLWLDQNNKQASGVPTQNGLPVSSSLSLVTGLTASIVSPVSAAVSSDSTLQKVGDSFNGYTLVALGSGPVIQVGLVNNTGNPANDYLYVPRGSVLKQGQFTFPVGGDPSDLQGGAL